MSETEAIGKIKKLLLPKWFWIVLALLVVVGMGITAYRLWLQFKGGKKETKKK